MRHFVGLMWRCWQAAACGGTACWQAAAAGVGQQSRHHSSNGRVFSVHNLPTSVIGAYTPTTKALWVERLKTRESPNTAVRLPDPIDKPPETTSIHMPFTSNVEMLEMYRNPWNRVRIGRVLEDLDSLAGNIAYTHCVDDDPTTLSPMLVTAAVERIRLLHEVVMDQDVTLEGAVVYTGKSSIDIRLSLQQAHRSEPSLVALFTFVARDPATGGAVAVNRVVPQTAQQEAWFEERRAIAAARKAARQARGAATTAAAADAGSAQLSARRAAWADRMLVEAQAMHVMPGLAAGDALLMHQTRLSNTFTCQPQQRNMHGRIFGGFLMRRAYELAFATTHMFAGRRPRFIEVDRVDFQKPVDVGDLVTFQSRVLHARNLLDHPTGARAQVYVEVEAVVIRPDEASSMTTNTFTLLFEVDLTARGQTVDGASLALRPLKRVLPARESEAKLVERFYVE